MNLAGGSTLIITVEGRQHFFIDKASSSVSGWVMTSN